MEDDGTKHKLMRKDGLAKAARQFAGEHDANGGIRTLQDLLVQFPDDPVIGTLLANALLAVGRKTKGKKELDSVLRHNPKYPMAHYAMGVYHSVSKHWEKAVASYRKAIGLYPPDAREALADTWQNLGCALWENRDKGEALEAWRMCLKLDPGNELAKKNQGHCTSAYGFPKSIFPAMFPTDSGSPEFGYVTLGPPGPEKSEPKRAFPI